MSENPVEVAITRLNDAKTCVGAAIEAFRELDNLLPSWRRKVNGAMDDCSAELNRAGIALQRLNERSGKPAAAIDPDEAAAAAALATNGS